MTKPNHEAIAAVNLQRQGFRHYYPRFMLKKPGATPVIRPLFPRYIFIFVEQMWRSLSGTRGISYVLMGEGGPQTVDDQVVDRIREREGKDGLYQLTAPPKFQPGEKVKAEEGPLVGLPLFYEGMVAHDRVNVLVEMLGRQCRVEIEEKILITA